jgi:hypothetical protein
MYKIGDNVVINYYGANQIGQITEVRPNRNTGAMYDVMSEKGTMYTHTPPDKPKLNQYINTSLTTKLIDSGAITTNLTLGWIGNYAVGTRPSAWWLNDDDPNQVNNTSAIDDDQSTEKSIA